MRLTEQQIQTIHRVVREHLGVEAPITLFGSRVDETSSGGDVDLLIELPGKVPLKQEIGLAAQLEKRLGCPVDILTTWPGQPARPIVEIARLTGARL